MKEHLHHHDHAHVNTASTPPQALALFAQFHHDVVITDMILPGGKEKLNGLEFLEQIRIMDPSTFRVIMSFAGSTSLVPFGAANAQLEDGHGHTIEGLHLLLRHPRLGLSIPPLLESAHH
jgi:CheY-like chemotaxis protein